MITRKNHKKCIIRVGEDATSSILSCILDNDSPTRKSVSERTGYSEVTVGKVMKAIYSLSLAEKQVRKPDCGGHVCAHLQHSEQIHFLIIDISTRRFSLSLVSSALSYDFHYTYSYSDALRYEENLLTFLNIGAQRLSKSGLDYSASVLISDNLGSRQCIGYISQTIPPKACDMSVIKSKISSIFGFAPDLVISPDAAVKQYLIAKTQLDSAYILIGQTLSAYYISKAGNLTVCKPWNIVIDNMPMSDYLCTSGDISMIFSSAARLINTLDATLSPKQIILQSDSLALGRDFGNEVNEFLSSLYNTDRIIKTLDSPHLAQSVGGALAARKWLFKRLVVSIEHKKA